MTGAPPRAWSPLAGDTLAAATVLVVDDDRVNVKLLERVLHRAGVGTVHGVTDPSRAVSACLDLQPDLVMLDLHMPGVDGLDVLGQLQGALADDEFLPVIVLTGDVRSEARDDALAAGAKDFVTKPFDHTEVVLRVQNLIETRILYDRVRRHITELRTELDERTELERKERAEHAARRRRVEEALAGDVLRMVFQPITDLASNSVVGVEALARFVCAPERPPNEWFAEAAEVGLGTELELAAVRAALAAVDRFAAATFVSVNISPETVLAPELGDLVARGPAARIVLELTEHHRIDCYDSVLEAIEGLRRHGVRMAVDDAGAGYAGLHHILRLRPEILKLDMALTRGIDTDPARRALATALVHFAAEIDSMIVAEGVETTEELDTLTSLGVQWAQGYLLGRPTPPANQSWDASTPPRWRPSKR